MSPDASIGITLTLNYPHSISIRGLVVIFLSKRFDSYLYGV